MILVVEDDAAVAHAMASILEDDGYVVELARDGEAALQLLWAGVRPALILLDYMMPRCDARCFRAVQLSDVTIVDLPVVVVSASTDRQRVADELGCELLSKPFQIDEILAVAQRYDHPRA